MRGVSRSTRILREHARTVWQAGVDAVEAGRLIRSALKVRRGTLEVGGVSLPLDPIESIAVVGAGKAGAAMGLAVEEVLGGRLMDEKRVHGSVNVPDRTVVPLRRIQLHGARESLDNQPTAAGMEGS